MLEGIVIQLSVTVLVGVLVILVLQAYKDTYMALNQAGRDGWTIGTIILVIYTAIVVRGAHRFARFFDKPR